MSLRYSALSTSYLAKLTADFHSVCQDVIERAMNVCFWHLADHSVAKLFLTNRKMTAHALTNLIPNFAFERQNVF
jgi:hypothetical protein